MDGDVAGPQLQIARFGAAIGGLRGQVAVFDDPNLPVDHHDIADFLLGIAFPDDLRGHIAASDQVVPDQVGIAERCQRIVDLDVGEQFHATPLGVVEAAGLVQSADRTAVAIGAQRQ